MNFNHDSGSIDTLLSIDTTTAPPLGGVAGTFQFVGTGALQLQIGTTAQRPTGAAGMIRANSDLTILEAFLGGSWIDLTKQGTVTSVAVAGSTGLVSTGGPITGAGTITLTLGTELQGLSALSANGLVTRTGAGTFTSRSVTGTAGAVIVNNGDGVAGAPTITLATVSAGASGTFQKFTSDGFGRVNAVTPVVMADITGLVDAVYVKKVGDTMTGSLTFSSGTVTGLPTPSNASDAAPKSYVDAAITGLSWKQAVRTATTINGTIATAFANGSVVDGVTLATGDRILIKNQTTQSENGIYIVAASGAPTRSLDSDSSAELVGESVFVDAGTVNADTGWVQTTNTPITVGTSNLVYAQFSGSGAYSAGTGLTLTGNTFSLTSPVAVTLGGTGLSTLGSANTVLGVNAGGTAYEAKSIAAGTGISVVHTANTITVNNTGVTSVGLAAPSIFTVSNSPVTTTGTLTLALASQTANMVFAAPNGSNGAPSFRTLAFADLPIKLFVENPSAPIAPTAAGTNSVAIGSGAAAAANNSFAVGSGAITPFAGSQAYANGSFATAGDAQTLQFILRNVTTAATATELFLDGVAAAVRAVMPNNSTWAFTMLVSARRTDAVGGASGYKFEGVIRKDTTAASAALVGTPSKSVLGETNVLWDVSVSADTTNGSLKVNVTGEAAKTIRWAASVTVMQVTN